jgi:serine/threonine protein kinase
LYYVMPYEEGQSLRDRLAHQGELPIAEAVRILRDVVDALSEAHEKGVVHRDIKPDNVLLTKHRASVTDFGVANAVSEATGAHELTTEGVALGTPAYMSPEQVAADKHIDHRADIYAVGALAYELLTGRPPFTGTSTEIDCTWPPLTGPTGARFHPIEIILSMFIKFAVIAVLGAPVLAVVIFEVVLNATAMFNHSNVRIPRAMDAVLRWLVVTPDMHRVHHSGEHDETNSNFGFNLPWWDRLLGTYRGQPRAGMRR